MSDRLDAFLSHQGLGSRSEVRGLIERGRVRLGGKTCRTFGSPVGNREVKVDNQPVVPRAESATLIVHKPLGLACSNDEREAPLLSSLYPADLAHLAIEPAGRLDRETTGLLIVSSEGQLIHRLTSPKRRCEKRYRIWYTGQLSSHAVERCERGMVIEGDDQPTLPARLELQADGEATLHLIEGRYHQVRRMIAALGGFVVKLHRDRIGGLDLPADLPAGAVRPITAAELALLG
jgi:16S rRNA pseudouridine516 synthase